MLCLLSKRLKVKKFLVIFKEQAGIWVEYSVSIKSGVWKALKSEPFEYQRDPGGKFHTSCCTWQIQCRCTEDTVEDDLQSCVCETHEFRVYTRGEPSKYLTMYIQIFQNFKKVNQKSKTHFR